MDAAAAIRIRRADERDIGEIMIIEKMSFTSPWTVDFFRCELYNPVSYFYIIEVRKLLAGYIIVWILKNEAHIANIAIHPDFRKRGYGEYLLRWAIERFRKKGAATITLEVNEKNNAARNLYDKMGFKIVGKKAKYYENNDDALKLALFLE